MENGKDWDDVVRTRAPVPQDSRRRLAVRSRHLDQPARFVRIIREFHQEVWHAKEALLTGPSRRSVRLLPELLMAIGAVHVAATPLLQKGLRPLLADGVLNAVGDDPARESAVWYTVAGLACVGLGDAARTALRDSGELPPRFGTWVLVTGAVIAATMPVSPGWAVMAIGALSMRRRGC